MPEHVPVLLSDVLTGLQLAPNTEVIDATLGGGGHTQALLEAIAPAGRVLGLEADQRTLEATQQSLTAYGSRFVAVHGNFRDLRRHATEHGFSHVDGILFDLGLSSIALNDAARGFSFQQTGPLDMRLDPHVQTVTAADILQREPVTTLATLFQDLGEERAAMRIATVIVDARRQHSLQTTIDLAELVARVKPRRGRLHPATQVFQALRMRVNDELGALTDALPQALDLLKPNGRLAVITFHSIEDRLVKRWMKSAAATGRATILTKHVITPPRDEQLRNPRSRSAKLRLLTTNTNSSQTS